MADAQQALIDLLSNNWNDSNTDSLTPTVQRIETSKSVDFGNTKDWILIHVPRKIQQAAGVGVAKKNVLTNVDIDVRTKDTTSKAHFLLVIAEVERILDDNIKTPGGSFTILNPDADRNDKSDGFHNVYRELITVQMQELAIDRG